MRCLVLTCACLYVVRYPQAGCEPLDMTPMAFDDEYINCVKEMEANLSFAGILEKEKSKDKAFEGAWDKAASEWEERKAGKDLLLLPMGFKDNHGIALMVYTDKNYPSRDASLPRRFNEAVRKSVSSRDSYMDHFHFKALHFYLATGLQLLKTGCRQVYRGIHGVHFEPSRGLDRHIRFGQFTSSSLSPEMAEGFGQDSYLNITTCFGVDIEKLSYDASEKEVLIPPNEVFEMSSYTKEGYRFVLHSTKRRCHYYNCAYLGGEKSQNCIYSPECTDNVASVTEIVQSHHRMDAASSSGALLISSTKHVQLFREFVINAAVLGLFVNL